MAPGAAATRSTRVVDFHTGKALHDVKQCHLNAAVFDSDWERQAAELLGTHPAVDAWVKNDRLGLVIPYRKDGDATEVPAGLRGLARQWRLLGRRDQGAEWAMP